jgi:hypothetical protein
VAAAADDIGLARVAFAQGTAVFGVFRRHAIAGGVRAFFRLVVCHEDCLDRTICARRANRHARGLPDVLNTTYKGLLRGAGS